MSRLGSYLKKLREDQSRSRRWVEKQSKERYPEDRTRHISHSYLRQLEEGLSDKPNRYKLLTLAELYGVDPTNLTTIAGYPESEMPALGIEQSIDADTKVETAKELIEWLEARGIHAEYFMNSIMDLTDESLHIVNRLITTMSVQTKQLKAKAEDIGREEGVKIDEPD